MTTLEILKAARELLSDEKRWTKRCGARNQLGRPVGVTSRDATCWCAIGAVARLADDPALIAPTAAELHAASPVGHAHTFNDAYGTTHADILALFGRAVAKLEAQQP